jgi:hypothetical protein
MYDILDGNCGFYKFCVWSKQDDLKEIGSLLTRRAFKLLEGERTCQKSLAAEAENVEKFPTFRLEG